MPDDDHRSGYCCVMKFSVFFEETRSLGEEQWFDADDRFCTSRAPFIVRCSRTEDSPVNEYILCRTHKETALRIEYVSEVRPNPAAQYTIHEIPL